MAETKTAPSDGYKTTELGPLPEEWEAVRLGNLATSTFGGGTPSTKSPEFWDGPIPWTTTAVIGKEDIYLQEFQRGITEKGLQRSSTQVVPEGSVLVGTRVGVGKAVVTKFDVAINQDITAIVPNGDVSPEFLALSLKTPSLQRWFAENKRGTTIKGVPRSDVLNLRVPFPPHPEQQAIADVLRTVQRARETTEQVIASIRELKKSLMRHLFTYGPVPVEEAEWVPLKETEIGPVPEHWDLVRLNTVTELSSGGTPSKKQTTWWQGSIPWASPKDLKTSRLRDAQDHISGEALRAGSRLAPAGTVLVVVRGMILARDLPVALTEVPMAFNQDLKAIMPGDRVDQEYLLYALIAYKKALAREIGISAHGTRRIGSSSLQNWLLPLPDMGEQRLIAHALSTVDQKIAAEENRKRSLEVLFKTLLRNLMTGRLRVKDLAEVVHEAG